VNTEIEELPYNSAAERAVLGAAMLNPTAAVTVVDALTPGDFHGIHQVVFEAIASLVDRGEPVDVLTVRRELDRVRGTSPAVDPMALFQMIEQVPVTANVGSYIADVRDASRRRDLIFAGTRLVSVGRHAGLDHEQRTAEVAKVLDRLADVEDTSTATAVADLIGPYVDRLEMRADETGVTTGWADLDTLLVRLRPGQLVTVGARPGMGKSVFLINLAMHVALKLGQPVLFASLEMSREEVLARMVAHLARVPLNTLNARTLNEAEHLRVAKVAPMLSMAEHLILDDDPGIGLPRLRAALTRMRRAGHPAALLCVDYLQLMTSAKRAENRQQEVSALSRGLKLLAKDFDVPIVVGSQLNRDSERRLDKRPMLADLRESGSVEQDSDVVILLHRDDVYKPESPRAGEIDLIVAKHRQGPTATIAAVFQGHYSRIADMAPEPQKGRS
jgi:replicative DNA helicase